MSGKSKLTILAAFIVVTLLFGTAVLFYNITALPEEVRETVYNYVILAFLLVFIERILFFIFRRAQSRWTPAVLPPPPPELSFAFDPPQEGDDKCEGTGMMRKIVIITSPFSPPVFRDCDDHDPYTYEFNSILKDEEGEDPKNKN